MYEMYYQSGIATSDSSQGTSNQSSTDIANPANSIPPEVTHNHFQGHVTSTIEAAHVSFGFFEDPAIKEESFPVIQEFRYPSNQVPGPFHA